MFFHFFLHDVLNWELYLEQFFLLLHFPAHEATVQCPVPFVLVVLRGELQVQVFLGLGLLFVDRQDYEYVGLGEVLHVLYFRHFDHFARVKIFLLVVSVLNPDLAIQDLLRNPLDPDLVGFE